MRELSLHLLDVAQNAVTAGATEIRIAITQSRRKDEMILSVVDNGCGMSQETLAQVSDPFYTTRTTRKVGLGIPLLRQAAELTGGSLSIHSRKGEGTEITAVFGLTSIDRAPLGDIASTMTVLIAGSPNIRWRYLHETDDGHFSFDTDEVHEQIGDIPIESPPVLRFIEEYIREGVEEIHGTDLD